MTLKRRLLTAFTANIMVSDAAPVVAQSDKEATSPTDGAVLEATPEVITMSVGSPMRLASRWAECARYRQTQTHVSCDVLQAGRKTGTTRVGRAGRHD